MIGLMRLGMATNKVSIVNKLVLLSDSEWRQLEEMQRQFDRQKLEGRIPPGSTQRAALASGLGMGCGY